MDWSEMAGQMMDKYDGTISKAIQARRKRTSTPVEESMESPEDEPDADVDDSSGSDSGGEDDAQKKQALIKALQSALMGR